MRMRARAALISICLLTTFLFATFAVAPKPLPAKTDDEMVSRSEKCDQAAFIAKLLLGTQLDHNACMKVLKD
jgi:hypothetical protein